MRNLFPCMCLPAKYYVFIKTQIAFHYAFNINYNFHSAAINYKCNLSKIYKTLNLNTTIGYTDQAQIKSPRHFLIKTHNIRD